MTYEQVLSHLFLRSIKIVSCVRVPLDRFWRVEFFFVLFFRKIFVLFLRWNGVRTYLKSTSIDFFWRQSEIAPKLLTPKSVSAGTKNSRSEGFLLTKHKHTNIPTMTEPFPPPAPWFWWTSVPHPREPLRKGLDEAAIEVFNIKL